MVAHVCDSSMREMEAVGPGVKASLRTEAGLQTGSKRKETKKVGEMAQGRTSDFTQGTRAQCVALIRVRTSLQGGEGGIR